jgi:hypothetical protein
MSNFECEHCHTQYINKRFFLKHADKCKVLAKKKEVKTSTGKAAFEYYKKFLISKKCYNSDLTTFMNSKYYKSFINFAKFVVDKKIPDISIYLDFVINKKILPGIWSSNIIYSAYVKHLDSLSPIDSVGVSILSLKKLSRIFDCDIEEVLPKLYINEIIELLHSRHLSPWFLLNSIRINDILTDPNITENQHVVLEMFINPTKWGKNFDNHKIEVKNIKKYLKSLNL